MSDEIKNNTLTDEEVGEADGGYGSAPNGVYTPIATGGPCLVPSVNKGKCVRSCKYNEDERGTSYIRVCTKLPLKG